MVKLICLNILLSFFISAFAQETRSFQVLREDKHQTQAQQLVFDVKPEDLICASLNNPTPVPNAKIRLSSIPLSCSHKDWPVVVAGTLPHSNPQVKTQTFDCSTGACLSLNYILRYQPDAYPKGTNALFELQEKFSIDLLITQTLKGVEYSLDNKIWHLLTAGKIRIEGSDFLAQHQTENCDDFEGNCREVKLDVQIYYRLVLTGDERFDFSSVKTAQINALQIYELPVVFQRKIR